MALIDDGRKKPILILGISFAEQFESIIRNDIRPCVCDFDTAKKLSEIAVAKNKLTRFHPEPLFLLFPSPVTLFLQPLLDVTFPYTFTQ